MDCLPRPKSTWYATNRTIDKMRKAVQSNILCIMCIIYVTACENIQTRILYISTLKKNKYLLYKLHFYGLKEIILVWIAQCFMCNIYDFKCTTIDAIWLFIFLFLFCFSSFNLMLYESIFNFSVFQVLNISSIHMYICRYMYICI